MRKTRYLITAVLLFLVCSCGKTAVQQASRELFAMDTLISIKAYGENCEEAVLSAENRIKELEKLLSVTDSGSDIFRLNRNGSAVVSSDTAAAVSGALEICESTGGALDITIYPVLREWGFTTGNMHVPSDSGITAALKKTGYENVDVSGELITLPEGYMIDLGACAKGYTGDRLIDEISGLGVSSAIINLGGNVQTLGTKPDGSDWTVGIADPFQPDELLGTLRVHDKAVVTSGGYQRYFEDEDGNIYIHILDPETGRPAVSGLSGVTVIGESGAECDALSTAFFVMGKEKAISYIRSHKGYELLLVTDDHRIYVTEGIAGSFRNSSEMPVEIINE